MLFEWDENKNLSNQLKHRISFQNAIPVFDDPYLLSKPDHRFDYFEERWQSIGLAEKFLLTVVHTVENDHEEEIIRIISARKARTCEARRYRVNQGYERGITSVKGL